MTLILSARGSSSAQMVRSYLSRFETWIDILQEAATVDLKLIESESSHELGNVFVFVDPSCQAKLLVALQTVENPTGNGWGWIKEARLRGGKGKGRRGSCSASKGHCFARSWKAACDSTGLKEILGSRYSQQSHSWMSVVFRVKQFWTEPFNCRQFF